jgi:hypothetical protein
MGMPDAVDGAGTVTFARPAPAGAHVRFQAYYDGVQVSFDQGASWRTVNNQTGEYIWGHALNVWLPVPAGATQMLVRGGYARDFYLMAATGSSGPTGAATATPMPPTPPTGILPTPVAIKGVPCTVAINGVSVSGTCSGIFSPSK